MLWFAGKMQLSQGRSVIIDLKTGINGIGPCRKNSTVWQESSALISKVDKWMTIFSNLMLPCIVVSSRTRDEIVPCLIKGCVSQRCSRRSEKTPVRLLHRPETKWSILQCRAPDT